MKKKKLLMITWRDIKSPFAGGAETFTHQILKRLKKKFDITVLTSAFPHCRLKETIDGINYLRLGSKRFNYIGVYNWRIYFSVFRYYLTTIRKSQHFDVVIEQINNIPFLYALYGERNAFIQIHQLCRQNWFYQVPKLLAWIGYLFFEPLYLWLLRNKKVITISQSTKKELVRYGFKKSNIYIAPVGNILEPLKTLKGIKKFARFTILSLGNIRNMKRTHHQVIAFELAKQKVPSLQMFISGSPAGSYAAMVFDMIHKSPYKKDIHYLGHLSDKQKREYLQKSHCILTTSTKEGWGLTVTEANSQGAVAIGYSADGLRDSIKHNKTGILCYQHTPECLAKNIVKLYKDKKLYQQLQKNAWEWSKSFTFENSAKAYLDIIDN
ncbi:glycosyltransferase family 4 protein [Candidatus Roizmanbacteria bacterium]|nr:glycosyltransferase family 4 protein [Candidatus Roizmanbacteria bacterium]